MAYYAALVSLVELLEEIVHHDRYPNILFDEQQIASVYEKFSLLQTLLDDYSPKDREAADSLERRIRDAAYQAQDIIESHISNSKSRAYGVERVLRHLISPLRLVCLYPLCFVLLLPKLEKEYHELEKVQEEVNSIVEELRIKISHTTDDLQPNYYPADAGTSNQASGTNTMVGFEELLITIKGQLCGEPSKRSVVSVVGMGGIGKTTLARKIFDDGLIVCRFDYRAWVTISQDYDLQKVLLDILDSMNVPIDKSCGVGVLGEKIYKHLKGRRYLITMDDMWETKVWDDLKRILPDDSNGSRVMITTRISNVASYANRFDFYHQMQFLNDEQSWNLFRKKVFCPPELGDIGRLIAKNCQGLPLAIVVVAGLLNNKNKTRRDWEEIARNVSSATAEHNSKILSLSYNHLPHHLKPLFLHIGGFPEDYEIRVSELVKLWIAEGFLKPVEFKSLEDVAEKYLQDLVNRNLVLITKKRSNGTIKCCGVHDVLRDLCIEISRYENFLQVVHYKFHPPAARNARRLYIHHSFPSLPQFEGAKEFGSHVRSIVSHTFDWDLIFSRFGSKLLRVLVVKKGRLFRFSAEIFELFHLRYLAASVNEIPPSISLLQNLQILIIKSEPFGKTLCSLPSEIREMPNLRHIKSIRPLHFKCEFFDEKIVGEPSILENLQTLSWVYNVKFTNEVIKMIPNLQKLKVWCYEEEEEDEEGDGEGEGEGEGAGEEEENEDKDEDDDEEAEVGFSFYRARISPSLGADFYEQEENEKEAGEWQKFHLDNLFHLCQLESLSINFSWNLKVRPLPESFAFPVMLKMLSLRRCYIPWKDMTVVGSLPNLQVLKLRDEAFVGEKWESVEGEFLQLKFLLMEELYLKYWQAENTHFPMLQHLKISVCRRLQEIPPEIGEIQTLELVEVGYSVLAAMSAMNMQEEQRDMGNYVLQVHVYPCHINFGCEEESDSLVLKYLHQARMRYKEKAVLDSMGEDIADLREEPS